MNIDQSLREHLLALLKGGQAHVDFDTATKRLGKVVRVRPDGLTFYDTRHGKPKYAAWLRAGESFRFPGGESLREQSDRVSACLDEIHDSGELPALVVCHGGSIRVMLCRRDPRGLDAFHDFEVPNVAVVRL